MSANPLPFPSQPEPKPGPKPAPAPPRRSGGLWKSLLGLAVLAGAGWLAWQQFSGPKGPSTVTASVRTATVDQGDLEFRVRVNGITSARNFANIVAPRMRGPQGGEMTITKMAASGSFVKKGDIVVQIDTTNLRDRVTDEEDNLRNQENSVLKKKVQQELDLVNLDQTLRVAKSELDKARMDAKAAEVRTEVDKELIALSVEEAEARYRQLQADVKYTKESHRADMRITEIQKHMQQIRLERTVQDIERFTITAPMDGMVVASSVFKSGGDQQTIGEGDRVGPGQAIMKIVDVRSMQVEGTINQAESSRFRIGQDAIVSLDAFPGSKYKAKLYSIGALAVSGGRQQYYIRTVPVRVQMLEFDNRVIPDLSASADILLSAAPNSIIVPSAAVEREQEKAFVHVKKPDGTFEKRQIEIGLATSTHVAVTNGVAKGDVVRLM